MKKVFLIGDSFGVERTHDGKIEVPRAKTYPELLKAHLMSDSMMELRTSNLKYRRLVELPSLIESEEFDICIVQLGIVDVYPRPLNQRITLSKSKFAILLKRISRKYRPFILRHIYRKPWSSENEIIQIITSCKALNKQFIFFGCGPLSDQQAEKSPGASEAIVKFNNLLHRSSIDITNINYIDVYNPIKSSKDPLKYIHQQDSHLTIKGNELYYNLAKEALGK